VSAYAHYFFTYGCLPCPSILLKVPETFPINSSHHCSIAKTQSLQEERLAHMNAWCLGILNSTQQRFPWSVEEFLFHWVLWKQFALFSQALQLVAAKGSPSV